MMGLVVFQEDGVVFREESSGNNERIGQYRFSKKERKKVQVFPKLKKLVKPINNLFSMFSPLTVTLTILARPSL